MKASLRPAIPDDLATVQNIVRDAYTCYIARMGMRPGPMLDDYATLIGEACVHVAERGGVIVGILVLIPHDDAMLLDNVAVAPNAQGSGVGRVMLQFAEREALKAGYRSIKLYTNEAMTENLALYARLGYVETHRLEQKGLRRVYMSKHLTGT